MALPPNVLVTDEEMIIKDVFYLKMRINNYLLELYHDAVNTNSRGFNVSFNDNVEMMRNKISVVNDLSAAERIITLNTLPAIPEFLSGNKFLNYKTTLEIYQDIGFISTAFNTQMSNIGRIIIYLSLPIYIMVQIPHLVDHYRQAEDNINYYLERLKIEKFDYYNSYKNYFNDQKE